MKIPATRCLKALTLVCLISNPAFASPSFDSERLAYDQISIGFIPSRESMRKGALDATLSAKSLTHHKNKDIQDIFLELTAIKEEEGIVHNAMKIHSATQYIEATYEGNRVRLFYSTGTNNPKYRSYEDRWKALHARVYGFIASSILPSSTTNKISD